jgi:putative PEP-CTERM system histidine kinase
MEQTFSFVANELTAAGFTALAIIFAFRGQYSLPKIIFSVALALTGLWAFVLGLSQWGYVQEWFPSTFSALRDAGWFAAILALLQHESDGESLWKRLGVTAGILIAAELGFALSGATIDTGLGLRLSTPVVQFATAIMGLVLLENLLLNVSAPRRWSVRLMAISLATLFVYNILLSIPQFLGGEPIAGFVAAQPFVYLLVLPLFIITGVRTTSFKLKVHSSRAVVFQSATLVFAGILLQGTALAALYLRSFGGASVITLSIVLGVAGVLTILVVLSSRTARSQIKIFISENFYNYKYDYRVEWTKFIQALSQHQEQGAPDRALRTLTDLLDSQGGVLWMRHPGWRQFAPAASWCFGESWGPVEPDDPILLDLTPESIGFIEVSNHGSGIWQQRFPRAWIAVPLHFRGELVGFAVLRHPRAARRLDWEDQNLVSLVAMQLALFLVHEQVSQELADSQQLMEFNKRVAFALHDLKNTIGQLKLVLHNANRFGDNPEFRNDMMGTIHQAVENLQSLMGKLRNQPNDAAPGDPKSRVDVCAVLAKCAERRSASGVIFEAPAAPIYVDFPGAEQFATALEHVVSNAVEASTAESNVHLRADRQNGRICVSVEDHGVGMSPEFIADELFRPLRTTKQKGLGIGAYQARAIMRSLGGDMEVHSTVGKGTTVSLLFPASIDVERGTAR